MPKVPGVPGVPKQLSNRFQLSGLELTPTAESRRLTPIRADCGFGTFAGFLRICRVKEVNRFRMSEIDASPGRKFHMFAIARRLTGALLALTVIFAATPAGAQDTREESLAAERAEKATQLRPYEPPALERKIQAAGKDARQRASDLYLHRRHLRGGGFAAVGPGFRGRFGDTGIVRRPRRVVDQKLQGRRRRS